MVLVTCARREENRTLAFFGNPANTRPLETGRYAHSNPNSQVPAGSPPFSTADR
jgi:hypothetical protein